MAKHIETSIDIDAPAHVVWEILADWERLPEWNNFVRHIEGDTRVGSRLVVEIWLGDRKPQTFKPRLLAYDPERELRWLGRLVVPGLFDGEHGFTIEQLGDQRVRFVHTETFRGLLVPIVWKAMKNDIEASFNEMNRALKERAEARAPSA